MMGQRLPVRTGDECDVITGWRRASKRMGRAGVTARIKRGMRRRERREGRVRDYDLDDTSSAIARDVEADG